MPVYFALGFIALLAIVYGLRWLTRVDPAALATFLKYLAIAVALVGVVLLIAIGRFGLVFLLGSLFYPLWLRWRAIRGLRRGAQGASTGQSSSVDTAYLSVRLDHDSGTIDGRIKAGAFKDRRLGELTLPELTALLAELRQADAEGANLLEAYLDRLHPDWHEGQRSAGERAAGGKMTREEALEVLGLATGASEAEIREAHHRLMLKVHPDHGGSTYLAARLNEARDVLLKLSG
jgi:DnaJ domain